MRPISLKVLLNLGSCIGLLLEEFHFFQSFEEQILPERFLHLIRIEFHFDAESPQREDHDLLLEVGLEQLLHIRSRFVLPEGFQVRFGQELTEVALDGHRFMVKKQCPEVLGRFLTFKNGSELSGCLTN